MIREKHLRWIWVLVCVLSICITTLIPRAVSSKEASKLEPAPFTVRANILMELNLMRNGDTRIYPPQNEPTEADQNGRGENEELVNRNFITLFLKGDILEAWFSIYSLHPSIPYKPNTIGLESYIVAPVHFLSPRLRLGIYHDSAHNQDSSLYGSSGIDFTSFHARFLVIDETDKFLDIWFTQSSSRNRKSPYYITSDATDFKQTELGRINRMLGAEARMNYPGSERFVFESKVSLFFGAGKNFFSLPDSLSIKGLLEYRMYSNITFGGFFEYRRNFQLEEKVGKDELFLGPLLRVSF